jgi:pilus assembly protein FimV
VLKTILKTSGYFACLFVSGIASATGLGGMVVGSNLGQPLQAEIELVSVEKADRGSIAARLASAEAFKTAGVDYPYALPKLKFEIVNRDSAQPRIRITSSQPVNEPFVTLLVEVVWSSGKLLREYTFLLDPVGYNAPVLAEAVKPVAPVVSAPAAEQPEPVAEQPLPVAAPEAASVDTPSVTEQVQVPAAEPVAAAEPAEAPVPSEQAGTEASVPEAAAGEPMAAERVPAAAEQEAAVPAAPQEDALSKEEAIPVADVESVSVVRGDSLSKIALKVKPAEVSLERMLVAMYRANSGAFMGKNMNRLKAGKIIRVPDAAEIEAVQQDEAVHVYRAQVDDWNAYRQQLAAVRGEAREQSAQQVASGKVTAAVTEKTATKAESAEVLKLSKGEAPGSTAGGSSTSKEEESIAKAKALKEAEERTAMLEKNVKDLQRLAELKKQQAEAAAKAAPAAEAQTFPAGASAPAPAKPSAKPAVPAPVEVPAQPAPSMLDSLLEDPVLLGGGAAGLIALLGAGLWLSRRRGKPASASKAAAVPAVEDVGSSTGRIAEPVMPSPDTGDFTQLAADTANEKPSEEVDPIAEADLFLTFGRDVQAEEVLKEALNSRPGDVPILLKLLSIYSMRKDTNAFITHARQVKDSGDEVAWQQAAAMGRELEPNNPYYGGSGEADAPAVNAAEAAEPVVDFDLGFGGGAAADNQPVNVLDTMVTDALTADAKASPAEDMMGTLVIQPSAASSESTTILSASDMKAASAAVMDFDITGATGAGAAEAAVESKMTAAGADDLVFDVTSTHPGIPSQQAAEVAVPSVADDLVFDVTSSHPGIPAAAEPAANLDDLVFDVTSTHSGIPAASTEDTASAADEGLSFTLDIPEDFKGGAEEKPSAPLDIGLGDISLNLGNLAGDEAAALSSGAKDERWQEVATKLDLAKAYQEMGDAAGAKEILDEVLRDGDEQQRATAQSMLEQL